MMMTAVPASLDNGGTMKRYVVDTFNHATCEYGHAEMNEHPDGEWVKHEDIPEPAIKCELWASRNEGTFVAYLWGGDKPRECDGIYFNSEHSIVLGTQISPKELFGFEINPGELYHYTPETGWKMEL